MNIGASPTVPIKSSKDNPDFFMQKYRIARFTHEHVARAAQIAEANYALERKRNPALPVVDGLPDLTYFAQNGCGAAAFEGDQMVGFLCFYPPFADAFRTTNVKGSFSPIHAHGTLEKDSARIYSLLYQATAEELVKIGVLSHAISLYTHDDDAHQSFFYNGFGLRCIDAIRTLEPLTPVEAPPSSFYEVPKNKINSLLNLQNLLVAHLASSPSFMPFPFFSEEQFLNKDREDSRYFAALVDGTPVAYLKIGDEGETFVTEDSQMMNIVGACCLPEYRGTGISHNLLSSLIATLSNEGYTRLGVDFESFNPTALGFWLKYFDAYTGSVVRRIDDKIVEYR
jgi:GNAT superfamily N-acetyltransferase